MVKTIYWIQHTQKYRNRKIEDKDVKALHKLMKTSIYGKKWKISGQRKHYLKCTLKRSHMSHKILDNNLVVIRKMKVTLRLHKSPIIRMCVSELSKMLIYEIHYDYGKNKYNSKSKLLFTDTRSWCMKLKLKMSLNILAAIKKCLIFSNYSTYSKYYDHLRKLIMGKIRDRTAVVVIEKFVALKTKMYSFLVDKKREHKKSKTCD